MSGIWLTRNELVTTTSEIVGYKSGLALTKRKLSSYVPEEHTQLWTGSSAHLIRIRPDEFESIVLSILYGLGHAPYPELAPPGIRLYHKYKHDEQLLEFAISVSKRTIMLFTKAVDQAIASNTKSIDPRPIVQGVREEYGLAGSLIALELLEEIIQHQEQSPWSLCRRAEWSNTVELEGLFRSESLDTQYGSFIDQRYIDYLGANFHDIDDMNWRKFEGLTCEFFERAGFYVEIGRGRNDNSIDARVWPRSEDRLQPPGLIVQCKRQKKKIDKVVVKALYADILDERAQSGLIVTTSALSPGASAVCTARGYPVREANRETLRQWVELMRTPFRGIFLGG